MRAENFVEEHLHIINSWWNHSGYGGMPLAAFPINSFMIYDGEMPIVTGCVYLTDTDLCYMDNIVSNPESTKEQRKEAVKLLFDTLVAAAKYNGKIWWSAHSKEAVMGEWSKQYNETQRAEGHYWFTGEL